jgi:membrane glycosyltransferase
MDVQREVPGLRARRKRLRLHRQLWAAFDAPATRTNRRPGSRSFPKLADIPARRPKAPAPASATAAARPYPALKLLPEARPLAMPRQDLARAPAARPLEGKGMAARRLVLLSGALIIAAVVAAALLHALGRDRLTVLEWVTVVVSTVLSGWVGFGFTSATAGFFAALGSRSALVPPAAAGPAPQGRIAILLPTYNESPGLILAAAEAIAEELRHLDLGDRYDFFILSDTRDEAVAQREAVGVLRLRRRFAGGAQIFYRRRRLNTDRKAGNIGEWVESQGAGYAYMLVLDADSLMAGETIASLSAAMDQDPRLGLLQTVPTIINAETPFARLQQFASRLYGPVFAMGQAWWSGSEGNYWGHNAMIRVAAFAESAGLPHLSGPRPFGGHILSHDFIEAALMRRRGWKVRTVAALPGSYEETPPTLLDTAVRDRRWCQGNLQHARVLGAAGLHWVSRLHLFCGIFAYLAPGLWLVLLACGAAVWPAQRLEPGSAEFTEVTGIFGLMLALLVAPKVMALGLAIGSPSVRAGFGGTANLCVGFLIESLVSLLTTPVMMVMQSVAVVEVLVGRDSGWAPQTREGGELSRRDAWRAHGVHVALGVLGALGAFFLSKYFLMWASPVFLSLTLSALLSLHTSRSRAGRALRRRGVLQIPEEARPPAVVARALELRQAYANEEPLRRQIDVLLRERAAVYQPVAWRAPKLRVLCD